jgi:hypothetical protein
VTQKAQPVRVGSLSLGIAMMLLLLGRPSSNAQTVSEYQVKAAYVYNFAKFVEWPAQDFAGPSAPMQLCVLSDPSFESELDRIVKGKFVAGRPVVIILVQSAEQSRTCQVLFINSSQSKQARNIVEALRHTSVLTVGENKGFVEIGGIINFVLRDDRVQFEINHRAANQAGLRISSRLLSVATMVVE